MPPASLNIDARIASKAIMYDGTRLKLNNAETSVTSASSACGLMLKHLAKLTKETGDPNVVAASTDIDVFTHILAGDALTWFLQDFLAVRAALPNPPTVSTVLDGLTDRFEVEYRSRSEIARQKLHAFQYTQGYKSVPEYACAFRALMLDIPDMAEPDRIQWFFKGLRRNLQPMCMRDSNNQIFSTLASLIEHATHKDEELRLRDQLRAPRSMHANAVSHSNKPKPPFANKRPHSQIKPPSNPAAADRGHSNDRNPKRLKTSDSGQKGVGTMLRICLNGQADKPNKRTEGQRTNRQVFACAAAGYCYRCLKPFPSGCDRKCSGPWAQRDSAAWVTMWNTAVGNYNSRHGQWPTELSKQWDGK